MVTRLKRRQTWLHLTVALAATALVALALGPERAAAARCADGTVPPGNSTVDQYSESIPDQCGNKPFNPPGGGGGASEGGGGASEGGGAGAGAALPAGVAATLDSLGPDGSAIAAIAASTGAPRGGVGGQGGGGPGGGDGLSVPGGGLDAPVGEAARLSLGGVLSALHSALGGGGEGDGLGVGLPLVLALMLLGGVGYALRQRARR